MTTATADIRAVRTIIQTITVHTAEAPIHRDPHGVLREAHIRRRVPPGAHRVIHRAHPDTRRAAISRTAHQAIHPAALIPPDISAAAAQGAAAAVSENADPVCLKKQLLFSGIFPSEDAFIFCISSGPCPGMKGIRLVPDP